MDDCRFDDLARGLDELVRSRRGLGRLLAGGALAALLGRAASDEAGAKPGKGRNRRSVKTRGAPPGRRGGGVGDKKDGGDGGDRNNGAGRRDGAGNGGGNDEDGRGGDRGPADGPSPASKGNGKGKGKGGKGGKKCSGSKKKCGKQCVNTKTNAAHCGGCNRRCAAGQSCVNGACQGGGTPGGGGCAPGLIACGGACVDPRGDEQHCGACGNACSGDLTCEGGACACAAGTRCGNDCVDPQTADDHCGACDNRCPNGQSCENGACVAAPCGTNQLDCGGGLCVDNADGLACCNFGDCGERQGGDLQCNTTAHKCECKQPFGNRVLGVCYRDPSWGGGLCNECCGSGSRNCIQDYVCKQATTAQGFRYAFCDCPPNTERCDFGQNSFKCTRNRATDDRRCGGDCIDCTRDGRYCCGGFCLSPGEPGQQVDPSQPCKEGCQRCTGGTICCRSSPGSALFGCVVPDPDAVFPHVCPGPPP